MDLNNIEGYRGAQISRDSNGNVKYKMEMVPEMSYPSSYFDSRSNNSRQNNLFSSERTKNSLKEIN